MDPNAYISENCLVNYYYCMHSCLKNTTRCDGNNDCLDSTDESLCTPNCLPNFCQNGGTCIAGISPPVCSCTAGYQGVRCQYTNPNAQLSTQQQSSGMLI
jgi:hypothetical protein